MTDRETTAPVDVFIRQSYRPTNRWEEERKIYEEGSGVESAVARFKKSALKKQTAREIASRKLREDV